MKTLTQYCIQKKVMKDWEIRVVFLDRGDLKRGDSVKIKGGEAWWEVAEKYSTVQAGDVKSVRDFDSDHRTKIERRIKI